jgi:hypothetical protein
MRVVLLVAEPNPTDKGKLKIPTAAFREWKLQSCFGVILLAGYRYI